MKVNFLAWLGNFRFYYKTIVGKLLKIFKKLFSKSFLNGARTLACGKLQLCLVGLRLHFPSENRQSCTASRFNAKAIAFASTLQKDEALLRLFGRSQYFRKGESVALRHPATEGRARLHFVQMMLHPSGANKGKNPFRIFFILIIFRP